MSAALRIASFRSTIRLRMHLAARLRIAGLLAVLSCGPAPAQEPHALTNQDVLQMLRADQPAKDIVARTKVSTARFDLSVDSVRQLAMAGATDAVLSAMLAARAADEPASAAEAVTPAGEVSEDKPTTRCPKCIVVSLSHYEPATKVYEPGILSPSQVRWLRKDISESLSGRAAPPFWYVGERTAAGYDFVWGLQQREGAQTGNWVAWVAVYDARDRYRLFSTACEGWCAARTPPDAAWPTRHCSCARC